MPNRRQYHQGYHEHAENEAGQDHEHGGVFGKSSERLFAAPSGVFLALGFSLSLVQSQPTLISTILYAIGYFFGGFYTTKDA